MTEKQRDETTEPGIVAANDVPAATNDLTDAPHLPTEPAAVEDALPSAIASADTEQGSHEDAVISQANAGPNPDHEPEGAELAASLATLNDEERAEMAAAAAFTPAEDAVVDEADAYADMDDGVWQCQNTSCKSTDPDRAFTGPRQSVVQSTRVPLACPSCGGTTVLYIGEREVSKEVA